MFPLPKRIHASQGVLAKQALFGGAACMMRSLTQTRVRQRCSQRPQPLTRISSTVSETTTVNTSRTEFERAVSTSSFSMRSLRTTPFSSRYNIPWVIQSMHVPLLVCCVMRL